MTPAPVHFADEQLLLDPSGALFWPARRLLAVADLHFEKGTAAAARGQLVPPWDTRLTLDRLAALLRRWRPDTIVALGDSFHDRHGATRLMAADLARLRAITATARFVWVLGNHDPAPPDGLGGDAVAHFPVGPILFRHQAVAREAAPEIVGHHHPKAHVAARGGTICRPCFVVGPKRLMLPALGAYTGGLDVRDAAIATLFPRGGRVFLLGKDRLFSFPYAGRAGAAAAAAPSAALGTAPA